MIEETLTKAVKKLLARHSLIIRRMSPEEAFRRDWGFHPDFSHALLELVDRRGSEFFFAQLGANDGVQADPIRSHILKYKLNGVLVEPVPDVYACLVQSYRGADHLTFVNAAITENENSLKLYRPRPTTPALPDWARGTITASVDRLIGLSFGGFTISSDIVEAIDVVGIPIKDFVTNLPRKLDLLQMDCEGYDLRLLRAFPFQLQKPTLINFEHIHIPPAEYTALLRDLVNLGYRFIWGAEDTCAVLVFG